MSFTIMEAMSCGIPTISIKYFILTNILLMIKMVLYLNLYNFHNSINFTIDDVKRTVKNKDEYLLKSKRFIYL